MQAFERFLVSNPDQRGLITYLQIAPKTRGDVPEYATLSRAVDQTLGRINGGLGEPGWVPCACAGRQRSSDPLQPEVSTSWRE